MAMNAKQAERWAKSRQRGRTRYIWVNGVLGWGVTMGLVWPIAMAAQQGWQHLTGLLPIALVGFPIGGYFFGVWTWRVYESQFDRINSSPATLAEQSHAPDGKE